LTPHRQRITLAEHKPSRGEGVKRSDPHPEEQAILHAAPEIAGYVTALKQKGHKLVALALRQLVRLPEGATPAFSGTTLAVTMSATTPHRWPNADSSRVARSFLNGLGRRPGGRSALGGTRRTRV
jgi:hypothetical protein